MMRSILTLITALSLSGIAAAVDFELLEGAYELTLRNVILPSSTAGTVVFKTCGACDNMGRPVNAETRYLLGERELPLPDFLAAVEELRELPSARSTYVGVHYDLKTNAITRIVVVPEAASSAPR